jgi:anthranilate phosphoribosyltransferase
VRTAFNLLGPLTNPAGARRQVMGVYAEHLVEPMAQVLARLGVDHALVVHGAGGLDELTPTGENLMAEVRDGEVTMHTLDPRPLSTGPAPGTPDDLRVGGDPAQNAAIIRTVFDGERGPRRDAVILNAAAAMLVGGLVDDFERGIDDAVGTIDSGAATAKLDELVEFTRARAPAAE